MPRWLYSLLLRCCLPIALLAFFWRGWRHADYRGSLSERLGLSLPVRSDAPLWLHAASVGEVQALLPLLQALRERSEPVLLTVGTPTGATHARRLLGAGCVVQAAPWDLPGAATRFLRASRPRAGVLVEAELWPNLVAAAGAAGVPLALVSARMSERSLRRHLRFAPGMMRATVRGFARIGAQDEASRARFLSLGAAAERVLVTGNLKLDPVLPAQVDAQGGVLRLRFASDRPVWVAGSTHEGEEQLLLDARNLLADTARATGMPVPLLVLAPRRPERFDAVWRWLQSGSVNAARSSHDIAPAAGLDVLLVDQMGTLPAWYAAGDVAFVGGSLVPAGGHNVLEPAALGRYVLIGPCEMNAPQAVSLLQAAGGLGVVENAAALAAALQALLQDRSQALAAGERARRAVLANQGATARTLALVDTLAAPA